MAYSKSVPVWCVFYYSLGKRDFVSIRASTEHEAAEIAHDSEGAEIVDTVDGPFADYAAADQFGFDGR